MTRLLYIRAHGLLRAGAMRNLASLVAHANPEILAVCEIGSGDTRSLATRFALQWAYRGRQALLWQPVFEAGAVTDLYLPASAQLRHAGLIQVNGTLSGRACTIATTQFGPARDMRAQLRFVRTSLRDAQPYLLFFACLPGETRAERVYMRGFERDEVAASVAAV